MPLVSVKGFCGFIWSRTAAFSMQYLAFIAMGMFPLFQGVVTAKQRSQNFSELRISSRMNWRSVQIEFVSLSVLLVLLLQCLHCRNWKTSFEGYHSSLQPSNGWPTILRCVLHRWLSLQWTAQFTMTYAVNTKSVVILPLCISTMAKIPSATMAGERFGLLLFCLLRGRGTGTFTDGDSLISRFPATID